MSIDRDIKIIEAILFASGVPVSENDLKDKIVNKEKFKYYLDQLNEFYNKRGINLIKTGSKWSFITSPEISEDLTIFKQQKRKISRAALETLTIVAYHQPITRSEIENIRGVQMGRGSIDYLMEIGWIKPGVRKNIPGKPTLWSTTELFLEHFGIDNIANLPNKDELKANGFLDKRSAIATISDLANNDIHEENLEIEEEENLDDFIPNNS
jgi:segregation and condensation protein B